jgi:hypothetical protein
MSRFSLTETDFLHKIYIVIKRLFKEETGGAQEAERIPFEPDPDNAGEGRYGLIDLRPSGNRGLFILSQKNSGGENGYRRDYDLKGDSKDLS